MQSKRIDERSGPEKLVARSNRQRFHRYGIRTVTLLGPAGSGKTALLENTVQRLAREVHICVLVGNLAARQQIVKLKSYGARIVPLTTEDLDAAAVQDAISLLNLDGLDLLLIEGGSHAPGLSWPDYGQDLRVAVFGASGGDDKACEYPNLVAGSDLVLLTKTDLLPYVTFNFESFVNDVRRFKPGMEVIKTTTKHVNGIDNWIRWLETRWAGARWDSGHHRLLHSASDLLL